MRQVGEHGVAQAEVLDEVAAARFEPVLRPARLSPVAVGEARGGAQHVQDPALRHIPALPAMALGLQAEVALLEIEEIAFVHQADVVEDLPPDHQGRARDPVGRMRVLLWLEMDDASWQQAFQQSDAQRGHQFGQNAEVAKCRRVGSGRGFVVAAGGKSGFGMCLQKIDQRLTGPFQRFRIGIQQPDVVWRVVTVERPPDRYVVAVGETAIVAGCNHLCPLFPAVAPDGICDLLVGAIAGIVVDHDHAGMLRQSCAVVGYRSQAFFGQFGDAIVDRDNKEFLHLVFLLLCVYVHTARGNHGMSGALSHSRGNFLPCFTDTAETFTRRL